MELWRDWLVWANLCNLVFLLICLRTGAAGVYFWATFAISLVLLSITWYRIWRIQRLRRILAEFQKFLDAYKRLSE